MRDKYLHKLEQISLNKNTGDTNMMARKESLKTEQMLAERNETHGDFREGAKISQHLKKVVANYDDRLTATQKESLDMIMHKVARLLNGDPTHADTWHDIIGYATLAVEDIEVTKLDNLRQDNAV